MGVGHAGAGLQAGEQKMGTPEPGPKGAHLDILLLKREMKDFCTSGSHFLFPVHVD